jgi:hypothetical protein
MLQPDDLRQSLRDLQYRRDLLRSGVRFGNYGVAPLVAFSQVPTDWRTACIAVFATDGDPRRVVEEARSLGAPLVFVCYKDTLQWWKQGSSSVEWLESIKRSHIQSFFKSHQDEFSPDAIYRAKTWGRFRSEYQLTFVDNGLMPLVEDEVGSQLSTLIERNVTGLKKRLGWGDVSSEDGHWLIQTVFWLVSGKILRDKGVPAFEGLDISDVDKVFKLVAQHYGSKPIKIDSNLKRESLAESAKTVKQFASLELTTTEALAHVYENALISDQTRSSLGTHSTPSYLVDYIVGNLAEWIAEIPENARSVFEPACGHAAFLVSAMRLLSELLPHEKQISSRRGPYLRSRLHGIDIDSFALELARLSLTLTDIPNPDGWDLRATDMFFKDELTVPASKNSIFFANPPFDNFSVDEKKIYKHRDVETTYLNKAAEMLHRILPCLVEGGVFGFVLPQTFLHSSNARGIRKFLIEQCELQEISLFPDKVFSFSDAESAIITGRRRQARRGNKLRYRRTRERDMVAFHTYYETSTTREIAQSRFAENDNFAMRLPDLEDLWLSLHDNPKLASVADLGQGLVYHSKDLPTNCATFSTQRFARSKQGFVTFDSGLLLHQLPTKFWMSLDPSCIRRPQHGTVTGIQQLLLNYAPASRGPWRLKALIDKAGHPVTSRFIPVRPNDERYSLEALWALLNSPVANGYAFCHLSKRDNTVGEIRRIPLPKSTDFEALNSAALAYLSSVTNDANRSTLKDLMLRMDCECLRLYNLSPTFERQLLNLFTGYKRVGIPFIQERFFPKGFEYPVSLSDFLEFEKNWAKTNRERGRLIDKNIAGTITPDEKNRLEALQAYADYHLEKTSPRPTGVFDELENRIFAAISKEGSNGR